MGGEGKAGGVWRLAHAPTSCKLPTQRRLPHGSAISPARGPRAAGGPDLITSLLARSTLAALLLLAGCKLVDQRTFERTATTPTPADLSRAALPKLPLLTIAFTIPDADWRPAVRDAVRAAEARKRDVAFSVVTPIPTMQSRDAQDVFIKQGQQDATQVAQELHLNGIPSDRITIGFRGDPGAPAREVRVYAQ